VDFSIIKAQQKSVFSLTLGICSIYAINGGVRGNFGIILGSIADASGISYADVSFVLAISQLVFGLLQPVFGIIAMKTSERVVLCTGVFLMIAGFLFTPFCKTVWALLIALGLFLPAGTAALSFGLLLSVVTPQLPLGKSSMVSGFLNASSGLGTTLLAPMLTGISAAFGLLGMMMFLGIPSLLLIPLVLWLCRRPESLVYASNISSTAQVNPLKMLKDTMKNRNYQFLMIGFFTCGFHMAILETHFFNQLTTFGIDRSTSAIIFSVYGVFTMIGSALSGVLCNHIRMKYVLGSIYVIRVVLAVFIIFMPKMLAVLMIFSIVLGLTSDSTVSPTSGLVLKNFGPVKLATLFGLLFLTHQIGCFFSAWFGGLIVENMGDYDFLWMIDIILCILATIVSFSVRED
jgi:Arabinose efflux permease